MHAARDIPAQNASSGSSPELRLLLASARWPQSEADRRQVAELLGQPFDPGRFVELAQHHRLVPLVAHNLGAAAPAALAPGQLDVMLDLRQQATANTYRALRTLAELRRLVELLAAAGVPVRVLKGMPLAQTVFGDISLRSVGDMDLLIAETAIREADQVLRTAGYEGLFRVAGFTPKRLAFYRTHWKDIAYRNAQTGFEVDLHWRCFRNSAMPGGDLCSGGGGETVSFGSFQATTLPRMETLLYLCVHGTLDGWVYLKSLADVSALARSLPADELERAAGQARDHGVLPELSAALLLCRQYFGLDGRSAGLLGEDDPTVAHILRFARRSLEAGEFLAGREAITAGSMMLFELGLRRSLRYRLELLLRVLFRARMWETIPLPDVLFAMYALLSPFEWIAFRVRQRFDKPPTDAGRPA